MDPIYINHTVMDKRTCKDFLALTWGKNAGVLRWVLLAVGAASILYGLWQVITMGLPGLIFLIGMSIMGGVALFLGLWGWKMQSRRYIRQQTAQWGDDSLEKDVYFYDDGFDQDSRLSELSFDYPDVVRVLQNKRTVLFQMEKGALLIAKAGFKPEELEPFLAFIAEKCPPRKQPGFFARLKAGARGKK